MVDSLPFTNFYSQGIIIPNLIVLPFCVSALGVYLHSVIFNGFRSYKFGLILLLMPYISVTQILYLCTPIHKLSSFSGQFADSILYYSYMLSPLKTWLFSAQYFESASLIVEFERKEIARKCTGVLFAVVTAGLIVLYFATVATEAFSNVLFS